jgi:uncharacterized protein YfaS (alpha-2-macroglobulin family)
VIAQKRVELAAASTTVELPIEPAFISNVGIDIDRMAPRRVVLQGSKLPLPEHTQTSIDLPVSIEGARLVMTTRATSKIVEPGADATFDVGVMHDGKPVADAEVALIVVDEAILALSERSFDDPLPSFYHQVGDGTTAVSNFDLVMDSGPDLAGPPGVRIFDLEEERMGHGIGGGGTGWGTIGTGRYGTIGHGAGMASSSRARTSAPTRRSRRTCTPMRPATPR